jgi:hypothetical protein
MAVQENSNLTFGPYQQKKPPILPFQQTAKLLPLVQPATSPFTGNGQPFNFQASGQQGAAPQIDQANIQGVDSNYNQQQMNANVLQAGQEKAIQGFQSQVMDQTSGLTQNLLTDPQWGFDPNKIVQGNMEQFDINRAKSMEAARQQLAPVMNSGQMRGDFMDLAIQGAQARSAYESEQEQAARKERMGNILNALAEGRATGEQERARFSTDIDALTKISGAAEGMENRALTKEENAIDRGLKAALANQDAELQTSLAELDAKMKENLLLKEQDFEGIQAGLDRQIQMAINQGNWDNAIDLQNTKLEFEAIQATKAREWETVEREARQIYTTSERVDGQTFETAMKYIDQQITDALADNDVLRQKDLMLEKSLIDLKMQTNGFAHDKTMAYLENAYAEASADNDVYRQQDILTFKHLQNLDLMTKEQDYTVVLKNLDAEIKYAEQMTDYETQRALLNAKNIFTREEAAKDRAIEQARVDLQAKGVNMQEIEQRYDFLQNEAAAGRADPNAAFTYIQNEFAKNGVTIDPAEENAARRAIEEDYNLQKYQFALTNPDLAVFDGLGNFVDLKDDGISVFNNFLNTSYYGPDGKIVTGGGDVTRLTLSDNGDNVNILNQYGYQSDAKGLSETFRNADEANNPNNAKYQEFLNQSPTLNVSISDKSKNHLGGVPAEGSIVNVGGRLMVVSKGRYLDTDGRNRHEFELTDLASGSAKIFSGMASGDNSINKLGDWAKGL